MRIFNVRDGEDGPLSAILTRMNADDVAITEGRVFVDRKRMHDASNVIGVGAVVSVSPPQPTLASPARILAKRDGFVAADKPAGIPTIADQAGESHAFSNEVARSLGIAPSMLHPTSRLDRGVSGVVIFALTAPARQAIENARAAGCYVRRYVALSSRAPDPRAGIWNARIGRAKKPKLRAVNGKDATHAETHFRTVVETNAGALLALAPITGRTHQLRVHAGNARVPLLGDRDYGGPVNVALANGAQLKVGRIALHCARVALHFEGEEVVVLSSIPAELTALGASLGIGAVDWEKAVSCTL